MTGKSTLLRRTGLLLGGLALTTGVASVQAQESEAQQSDTTMQPPSAIAVQDSAQQDSTVWGTSANRNPDVQNPPGYRGMERPVNVFPPDSGRASDSLSAANGTTRVTQMQRQDSAGSPNQNPPGYRGMERPVATDSAVVQQGETTAGKAQAGKADKKKRVTERADRESKATKKGDTKKKKQTADDQESAAGYRAMSDAGDSASTVRMGQDTTGDTTRFEIDARDNGEMQQDSAATSSDQRRDSVDIIHRERKPAPGVGHEPPPYTPDSQRVWVEQRPEGDSVRVDQNESSQ